MRKFIGRGETVWFFGVVEDRDDPIRLGRVRVRCYGYHSDDKGQIPTSSLPWAIPVNPVQSASSSGVGHSPTGLVEGSWVFGIFIDGERAQEPLILGSLAGLPANFADPNTGFNDPTESFPRYVDESDVSRAARDEEALQHESRITKENLQKTDAGTTRTYYTATPPKVTSVAPDKEDAYYSDARWQEPPVSGNTVPDYPLNHVREFESGHLEEFDDTEGARRYHRYHPAGSFEEVIDDGTRIIKVVGEDYEMYLDGKNIFIDGNVNMTVTGDKRELIQGNYHLEVEGDMTMDLHQSWQTKVAFNQETEIGKSRSTNIGISDNLTLVTGDQTLNIIQGSRLESIKTNDTTNVQGNVTKITFGDSSFMTSGNLKQTNLGTMTVISKGNVVRTSKSNETVTIDGSETVAVGGTKTSTAPTVSETYGTGDYVIGSISHVGHTHTDPSHVKHGSETSTPN